jgi:hypothetical protein
MSTTSPWFGLLYVAAFSSALVVILGGQRLAARVGLILSAVTVIVAAYCIGIGVRGATYDISGTQAQSPVMSVSAAPAVAAPLGRPASIDNEISIDRIDPPATADFRRKPIDLSGSGTIMISGWAFDFADQARCRGIAAVTGRQTFAGTYGLERPDVGKTLGAIHRFTGYQIVVRGTSLAPGKHTLEIRCIADEDRSYASAMTLSLQVNK